MLQKLCVGLMALSFIGGATFAADKKVEKKADKKAEKKADKKGDKKKPRAKGVAGIVKKVDTENAKLTVAVRVRKSKEGKLTTYDVKGVTIKKGRKQTISLGDLKEGQRVRVIFEGETEKVKAVIALPERKKKNPKKPKKDAA